MGDWTGLLSRVARGLGEAGLGYMLIGGQAVLIRGIPRYTEDIDITVGLDLDGLDRLLAVCDSLGLSALPDDPRGFARRTNVVPTADQATGIRVDLILSTLPYEQHAMERAEEVPVGGVPVRVASAEDLILHKLFAGRPRDLEDAEGIVSIHRGSLDWEYLERWGEEFSSLPERGDIASRIRDLKNERRTGQ